MKGVIRQANTARKPYKCCFTRKKFFKKRIRKKRQEFPKKIYNNTKNRCFSTKNILIETFVQRQSFSKKIIVFIV